MTLTAIDIQTISARYYVGAYLYFWAWSPPMG